MSKKKENNINIELDANISEGVYANLAVITHSDAEFVVDFIKMMPGAPKAKVKSRIILSPMHAKRLLHALKDNIDKFESQHGKIVVKNPMPNIPMTFGGPTGEA